MPTLSTVKSMTGFNGVTAEEAPNLQLEEWSTQTNQDPRRAKAALKCLEYVPKKHLTKIGSDQNPTLLHVAARAAIKFKDQTYVALVAILSVLVNFNKTLYHSMDEDTSSFGTFATPLQLGDRGSSCPHEMARRHWCRHNPPGDLCRGEWQDLPAWPGC